MSKGATYIDANRSSPQLADLDQLKLRYDAPSNSYEIKLPASSSWLPISASPDTPTTWNADSTGATGVLVAEEGSSASLIRWWGNNSFGVVAVAIPTDSSAVPLIGTGYYFGPISGNSSEYVPEHPDDVGGLRPSLIIGSISLTFDFGSGTLKGDIDPDLWGGFHRWDLPSLNFTDTVHGVGSTTFSGKFNTSLSGLNSFSGLFAGPSAGEVAGNFAFPYQSPLNGSVQQASGAFVASNSRP